MLKYLILMSILTTPSLQGLFIDTKKRTYEAQIHGVEYGTFTLLVFSAIGGIGDQAIVYYKRLTSLLSEKRNEHYGMGQILFVFLLRSAIHCLCGSCSSVSRFAHENLLTAVDLIQAETGVPHYINNCHAVYFWTIL